MKSVKPLPRLALLWACAHVFADHAQGQGVAAEGSLETVTVIGAHTPLDPNLPTTSESRTAEQLKEQNFVNVEDALKYLPDVTVRKRYIGDRNALVGGRSAGSLQAPRALVYADGYLVSQFLGQFNAPRWNVVAPEELARVDVLYGPFSALYPGNSIGTTIIMTTRQPKTFEASFRVQAFSQRFDDAGYRDTYAGHQESAWIGDKAGAWTYTLDLNRLRNRGQPMQYVTLQAPSSSTAAALPVTGAAAGVDPAGKPWYFAGPNGSALEDNTQEQTKLKLGYDFSATLYGEALYTRWRNDGRRHGATLLRDGAGNPVYSGLVSIGGVKYGIPANAYAPQRVEEIHDMLGFKLRTRGQPGWNASLVATLYDIGKDLTRTAGANPPAALAGGEGTIGDNGGTGWRTVDVQGTYTPPGVAAPGAAAHALAFGFHSNRYRLASLTSRTPDWREGAPASALSGFFGKTSLQALFAQDTWRIAPQWRATFGLRYERWKAFDGRRASASSSIPYAARSAAAWSPKASVSYAAADDWLFKISLGKGVRFPTVAELFQGSIAGAAIVNHNPGLRPERAYAKELSGEREVAAGMAAGTVRLSVFEDDVRDTIYSQTNITVVPNVTNIQNIDRVRTRGVELSTLWKDVGLRGLGLIANVAWSRGDILGNANNPALIGKTWVRVPRVRANLMASYRPNRRWMGSLAVRRSGRQYGSLDNSDSNPGVFGGTSSYTVWDAKLTYRFGKHIEASIGIDNLSDVHYYVFHPYPGRTLFGEIRANFQ
ncbi:MAG TPA: TonB-dependent receptor [Paucimonas sp.]|nr:TonB-dependent receptor [Paucimonas sp.]